MATKIYIEPHTKISYACYYIQGFYEIFGRENVRFASRFFRELDRKGDPWSFDSYMPVVMVRHNLIYKIIIDFGDDTPIRNNAYRWCDVYAKINYSPEKTTAEDQSKILVIAPGFGIKTWNLREIVFYSLSNLFKTKFDLGIPVQKYFREYLSQVKAKRLEEFTQTDRKASSDYIFLISTLWSHQNCLEGTNLYRKIFMENAKKSGVTFEGGFFLLDQNHPQYNDFKTLIYKSRIPLSEYMGKTKQSLLVFNTPAVHNCHGWKLG